MNSLISSLVFIITIGAVLAEIVIASGLILNQFSRLKNNLTPMAMPKIKENKNIVQKTIEKEQQIAKLLERG